MSLATLSDIEQRALGELASCSDESALRAWHTRYFGKQGEVVLALKGVGATKMACAPNLMAQESAYLATLGGTVSFAIACNGDIVVASKNGNEIIFARNGS